MAWKAEIDTLSSVSGLSSDTESCVIRKLNKDVSGAGVLSSILIFSLASSYKACAFQWTLSPHSTVQPAAVAAFSKQLFEWWC